MYESPINMIYDAAYNNIKQYQDEVENKIVCEITERYAIDVNKDELIKALNYDRNQYNNGYADGKAVGYHEGYLAAMVEMGCKDGEEAN